MEKFKLYFLNNKKYFIIIGMILLMTLCFLGYYFHYKYIQDDLIINETIFNDIEEGVTDDDNPRDEVLQESKSDNVDGEKPEEVEEKIIEYIYVDVKGYVNKPGVYKVEKNDNKRVYDLITLAGGLKKDADTSIINMSTKLKDEMVIIIYSKKEIQDFVKTKEEIVEKIEICDKEEVKNDVCICEDDVNNNFQDNNDDNHLETAVGDNVNNQDASGEIMNKSVNINIASKELLMTLSGIGESKALAIIDYREKNGLFKKIEDIKNVSGIGDSAFEKIKDFITVK